MGAVPIHIRLPLDRTRIQIAYHQAGAFPQEARAMVSPIPWAPPVITATLSASSAISISFPDVHGPAGRARTSTRPAGGDPYRAAPRSTETLVAVTNRDSSLAGRHTASAISSGWAITSGSRSVRIRRQLVRLRGAGQGGALGRLADRVGASLTARRSGDESHLVGWSTAHMHYSYQFGHVRPLGVETGPSAPGRPLAAVRAALPS